MTTCAAQREWCRVLLFLMHVELAKVRVLLVKAQSPESETSRRNHTLFNLSLIHWLSLKITGTILNLAFLHQCLGNKQWGMICRLQPCTKGCPNKCSSLTLFLQPQERNYGAIVTLFLPHLESKRRYFLLLLIHSTNIYQVSSRVQAPF